MNGSNIFLIVIVVLFIVGSIVISMIIEKKRIEAMSALALRLGLQFSSGNDYHLADQYHFINGLALGDNRYAYNILHGDYQGQSLTAFHYHYETHTHTKNGRSTTHHYLSVMALKLPLSFPELVIAPEGIFSKVAQALGYADIDFESHEFSNSFCVRSPNKKFAYDICNAQMIDFLLGNKQLRIEIEKNVLAFVFNECISPEKIEENIPKLIKVRSLFPEYLFTQGTV
jgi:hypothetical protein